MAKKITQKEVVQTDLWQNTIDSTEALIKLVDDLNAALQATAKISLKVVENNKQTDFTNLKGVSEEVDKINKAFDQKVVIDKERLKLEQRLSVARSERGKDNAKLRAELLEQNKANREAAKDALGLNGAYAQQSKRLIKLRKELKDVLTTEKTASKATRNLAKEVERLDRDLKEVDASAGQFQRNVVNYPETLSGATKAILATTAAAVGLKGGLDGVSEAVASTSEGNERLRETQAEVNGLWDQTKNVISSSVLDAYDNLRVGYARFFGDSKDLFDVLKDTSPGFNRTADAADNFAEKVKESSDAQLGLTKRVIQFEKDIRPLQLRLTELNGLIEQQQIIAGDSTRSFEAINDAILRGQNLQIERARINISIAREELAISQERIRIANLAGGASVDLLNQETEAINKLRDAENDLKNEILENEKEISQVKQDRLERDLDILIDGFDNQKTINERIIANEKETLAERASLLEETRRLADESFEGQKEALEELSNAGINVDELLGLDATELQVRIRQLEQSEIIEGRTLEVVRERRLALLDLEEATQDLNDAEQEAIDLRKDIIAQEEALNKQSEESLEQSEQAIRDLEKDRENNEIASLRRRIELTKEGSIERLRLEKELNDALIEQSKQKDEEISENEINSRESTIEVLQALNDKFFNDQLNRVDEEIDAARERESQLQDLADEGNADAAASLAQNQKDQAEAVRKKEELLQKEKQFELALAVISAFNAELDSGKSTPEALASAISSTTVLTNFVNSLPGFIEGTENVGESLGSPQLSGKDGHIIRVDGKERIVDPQNNKKMGGISNDLAANVINDFNNDLLTYNTHQIPIQVKRFDTGEKIIGELKNLEKSIVTAINDKETYLGSDIDTIKNMINRSYKKGSTITKLKSRGVRND